MNHAIETIDLTPRFLHFYERATEKPVSEEERFRLWQEHYGFAAVPPTPEGMARARQLLDAAWERYPAALEIIRQGAAAVKPSPQDVLPRVAAYLECQQDIHLRVIVFVGAFEENLFTASMQGKLTLALPVEQSPERRALALVHELTHIVHAVNVGFELTWERSVARIVLEEGLAMRVAQALEPGHPDLAYVEFTPGWFDRCRARHQDILNGLKPFLEARDSEVVWRFTMGEGTVGFEREAYYAGWFVVRALSEQGMTLAELSKVEEEAIPSLVRRGLKLAMKITR